MEKSLESNKIMAFIYRITQAREAAATSCAARVKRWQDAPTVMR